MDISKHLERAAEAVRKKNFDFAITLFNQALAIKPDHREARLGLLRAAARNLEFKRTPKVLRLIQGFPHLVALAVGRFLKNNDLKARASQSYLRWDPHSVSVNFILGSSLESLGHLGGASAVYEFVTEFNVKNVAALKKAGFLMYRLKDIPASLELFEKVLAIAPRDAEAEKMRKNLAAEDTLATSSYTKAGSSLDLVVDKEEAARQQREARIHKDADELDREEADLRRKLEADPGDKRVQRDLGDLLVRKKDYERALEHLRSLLSADPGSFEIRSRIGDVEILVLKDGLAAVRGQIQSGGDSGLKKDLAEMAKKLLNKQVEEYSWRVKEHPTDLNLWYRLGQCVFRAGKMDAAIEAFQHSVKDPRHKVESLQMLGRCFREKGLYDLALKQFQTALDAVGESGGRNKDVIYDLGDVHERMGDRKSALSWFSKIYEIDINYKD
ncbi:MAG: tetratricopeptide repeat protein, partial [bacterium]